MPVASSIAGVRGKAAMVTLVLALAVASATFASAGDVLPGPAPAPAGESSGEAARSPTAEVLQRAPQCEELTNACETCRRPDAGTLTCSLPGIACQPGEWRCTKDKSWPPLPGPVVVPAPSEGAKK